MHPLGIPYWIGFNFVFPSFKWTSCFLNIYIENQSNFLHLKINLIFYFPMLICSLILKTVLQGFRLEAFLIIKGRCELASSFLDHSFREHPNVALASLVTTSLRSSNWLSSNMDSIVLPILLLLIFNIIFRCVMSSLLYGISHFCLFACIILASMTRSPSTAFWRFVVISDLVV